jgi:hypothetical protein
VNPTDRIDLSHCGNPLHIEHSFCTFSKVRFLVSDTKRASMTYLKTILRLQTSDIIHIRKDPETAVANLAILVQISSAFVW